MEHSGFTFQQNAGTAIEMLSLHTGGKVSEALRMALMQENGTRFRNILEAKELTVSAKANNMEDHVDTVENSSFLPSKQRRSKLDKDVQQRGVAPTLIPPPPEANKNRFCCFGR